MKLEEDKHCFACGEENPIGLKLTFSLEGEKALGYFTAQSYHQGYKGMMHGGLVATLIDEAMAHYLLLHGYRGVTGRLDLRFRRPAPLGEPLTISAEKKRERRDWILLTGRVEDREGLLAEGEGLFHKQEKRRMRMEREEALALVEESIAQKNLVKHCLAVEAVMERLAEHFGEDRELWGLTGLLHDIDYDETYDRPEEHSLKGGQLLEEKGLPEDLVYAVKAHNEVHGLPLKSLMDKALYAADPLTGLIVAAALIHPKKKLSAIDTGFVMNRFQESSFARGANRDQIGSCKEMDLSLEEFVGLGLEAMQGIRKELGFK